METGYAKTKNPNQLVRSHSIEWQPLSEPGVSGVFVKVLRFDKSQSSDNTAEV
jgi:hypothetical protein